MLSPKGGGGAKVNNGVAHTGARGNLMWQVRQMIGSEIFHQILYRANLLQQLASCFLTTLQQGTMITIVRSLETMGVSRFRRG
jgi:hypothetical protein